ncbi:MAG TPA: YjbQ family protein [Candidatus Sulfotelmatobacter sp.]|nr:YjbQ family protein [Candidatus Sulfotelmatobacter sp.]
MKTYLKELKFPSTKHTYIKDITKDVNDAIRKSKTENGFVIVNSKHTTLGILVNEIAEPNLLQDMLEHTLSHIPEDKRSTRVHKEYKHPTKDYKHRCQDNPFCDEIDEDYNAAAHIRAMTFSHASVSLPVRKGSVELGKYQQIAIFEHDGRDGTGKNPIRQRTVQVWIYPSDEVTEIK